MQALNFERFKARVKEQAAIAADAARSVRNFDAMAANDDYIHHDDLRTPDARKPIPARKEDKLSPASSRSSSPPPTSINSSNRNRPLVVRTKSKSPTRRYSAKSSVDDILSQASHFSSLVNSDEEGDDDKDNDVEFVVRSNTELKKKNPKRFMEQLDDRLSKTDEGNDRVDVNLQLRQEQVTPSPSLSQSKMPDWGGWIAKSPVMAHVLSKLQSPIGASLVTGGKVEERRPMIIGPLSSLRVPDDDDEEKNEEDPMEHHVVVSSSMLGADEQAQLMRMSLSTRADPLTTVLGIIKQNPQFAFILFTFVLGYVVYFYSRHKEEIDDVT